MTTEDDAEKAAFPWTCPKHPTAGVLHSWTESQYVFNGYPAGNALKSDHRYECAECRTQLAPPQ